MEEPWVDRERRTAQLVQACYRHYLGKPTAAKVHALCKLTWITKNGGDDDLPDNTRSVTAPALSVLAGMRLSATDVGDLGKELRRAGVADDVVHHASRPVGFTNFYSGFRAIALTWMEANLAKVMPIVRAVVDTEDDEQVRAAYAEVEALRPLPRPGAGDMPAFNLLTPALACLEPRARAPIINSRQAVRERLRRLGLSSASLVQQYDGLLGLIGQAGVDDAFGLDTADDDEIERAIRGSTTRRAKGAGQGRPKPMVARSDEDLEYLRSTDPVAMKRLHNSMTNALLALCEKAGLALEEGSEQVCLFDALIRSYLAGERHLLVEVKTDATPAMCHMAVGQLLDYRRQLAGRAAIDLAVLFPSKPEKATRDFLAYVGVKATWFNADMTSLEGHVRIAPMARGKVGNDGSGQAVRGDGGALARGVSRELGCDSPRLRLAASAPLSRAGGFRASKRLGAG